MRRNEAGEPMGLLRANDLRSTYITHLASPNKYLSFFALRIFFIKEPFLARPRDVFCGVRSFLPHARNWWWMDGRNDQTDTSFIIYMYVCCTLISPVSDILLEYMYQQERAFPQKKQNIHKLRAAFLRQITPYLARLRIDAMPIPYFLINQAIQDECLTLCTTSENSGLRLNPPAKHPSPQG